MRRICRAAWIGLGGGRFSRENEERLSPTRVLEDPRGVIQDIADEVARVEHLRLLVRLSCAYLQVQVERSVH